MVSTQLRPIDQDSREATIMTQLLRMIQRWPYMKKKADNRYQESALMKKIIQPISSKFLLGLFKHPCPSEIKLTNWRFMFQDLFKTLSGKSHWIVVFGDLWTDMVD